MLEFNRDDVDPRIFIVGCSRSGTTLLQTLIASHPLVTTFPETNLFLQLTVHNIRSKMEGVFSLLKNSDLSSILTAWPFSQRKRVHFYLSVLDKITLEERKKKIWVEKTPRHIFSVDTISKYVPNSHIIYIIRDGREVVTSIVKRAKEFGNQFEHQNINYAIDLWNDSTRVIENKKSNGKGCVVKYENLVDCPQKMMIKIGQFLELDYTNVALTNRAEVLEDARMEAEGWKDNVADRIKNRNNKFDAYFSGEEKEYICENLMSNSLYEF
jgi:hypothetical protein